MSRTLAAVLGGAAGAVALVGVIVICIYLGRKRSLSRTSETGSSDPSVQLGAHAGIEFQLRDTRRFVMEELLVATKNFSEKNLIGQGKFGEVYKGLLQDGMLVAIKRRSGFPSQEFIDEVRYLSSIQHRNLVTLLGYCQENNLQFLIYEYVPNGSASSHLYALCLSIKVKHINLSFTCLGTGQQSPVPEKLEFKHRLLIAQGAAKGLAHLHSQSPRLVHKDFKTANVLVDENFIAKVADAGLRNFLGKFDVAGPSSEVTADDIFLAPEVKEFKQFSEKSDVYSFGVFLLELVCGREATESVSPDSNQNLVDWVTNPERHTVPSMIDERMGSSFTGEGIEDFFQLIGRCVETSSERRAAMSYVVMELDRILEKEITMTTVMGEGTPTVTLGSQLFRATK